MKKNVIPIVSLILLTGVLLTQSFSAYAFTKNRMTGLCEGRIFINVIDESATVTLRYTPLYGWNEPLLIFSPDGRIMENILLGHEKRGSRSFCLNKGPGIYQIIIKPSYVWDIETDAEKMIFEPVSETASLFRKISDAPLFLKIPPHGKPTEIYFTNLHHFKAREAGLTITDSGGLIVADVKRDAVTREESLALLTNGSSVVSDENQAGSDFSPETMPQKLKPVSVLLPDNENGWTVITGATENIPARVGIWSSSRPILLSSGPSSWFEPDFSNCRVDVELDVAPNPLNQVPRIGLVGNMGAPGSVVESILKEAGQQADKLFLHQAEMMNETGGFTFPRSLWFSPAHETNSLIVFRSAAAWMKNLDRKTQVYAWATWCKRSAEELVVNLHRTPDTFSFQVLNEPNLETDLATYLYLFNASAAYVKSDSALNRVQFSGPGIGSGEENDILDWEWIVQLLEKADPLLDIVTWNMYRIKNPEDTFLFRNAIMETDRLIRTCDRDGSHEKIIIGATNRQGGLAPDRLFNSKEAAIWWASAVIQSSSTDRLNAIYYYNTIDKGFGRKKGMFDHAGTPKIQVDANRVLSRILSSDKVYTVITNHEGIEALASEENGIRQMLVLNKGRVPVSVTTDFFTQGKINVNHLCDSDRAVQLTTGLPLKMEPGTILSISE